MNDTIPDSHEPLNASDTQKIMSGRTPIDNCPDNRPYSCINEQLKLLGLSQRGNQGTISAGPQGVHFTATEISQQLYNLPPTPNSAMLIDTIGGEFRA